MLYSRDLTKQIRFFSPLLYVIFGVAVSMLVGIGLLRVFLGVDIGELTRDPIHKTGLHPFVGFVSNLGVILWGFTAAVCFFSSFVLRRSGSSREGVRFYLYAGLITTWLMLDDLFLFHDVILREYVGIREYISYPLYVALVALFFYVYRHRVLRTEYVILLLSIGFFIVSLTMDLAIDNELVPGNYLFEDGFKFLGIVAWLVYFTRSGFADVMAMAAGGRKSRMKDGVCSRCGSGEVSIFNSLVRQDLPGVPLAAIYRYEKPIVTPLRNEHLTLECKDCGYREIYISEQSKLVSVPHNMRQAG